MKTHHKIVCGDSRKMGDGYQLIIEYDSFIDDNENNLFLPLFICYYYKVKQNILKG